MIGVVCGFWMVLALFFKKKLKILGRIAAKEVKKELKKTPERAATAKHKIVEAKRGWQELRTVMRATRNPLHGLPQPHPAACPPPLPQTAPQEAASCFYTYAAGQPVACIATPAPDDQQPSRTFSAGVSSAPPAAPQLEWKMVPTHQLEAEQATARRRSIDLSAAAQATAAAEAAMLEAAACAAANGVTIGGGGGSGGSTPAATGTPPSSRRARSARAACVSARAVAATNGGNSGGASNRSGGGASNRSGGDGGGASNRSGGGSNRAGHGDAGVGVGGASGSGSFNSGNTRKRSFKSQVAAERALRSTLDDTRSCSIQAIMAEAAASAEAAATAERAGDADGASAFARAVDAVETRDRALAALVAAAAKADSDGPSRAPSCGANADAGTAEAPDSTLPSRTVSRDPARDALAALERSAIEALSSSGKAGGGNAEEQEEERPAWKIALEEMRAADALAAGVAAGPAPATAAPAAAPAVAPAAAPAAAPSAAAAAMADLAAAAAGTCSMRKRAGSRRASGVQETLDALDPADLKSYMRKVGAACAIESGASAPQKHRRRRTKELAASPAAAASSAAAGGCCSSRRRTKPPDEVRV